MADGFIPVQNVTADKKLDTTELTVGANTVERERVQIAGAAATELADVKNATPSSGLLGLVVRPLGQTDSGGTDMTDTGNHALKVSQAGTWNVTTVTAVTSLTNALPAGTNVIGTVGVLGLKDSGGTDMTDTTNHALKTTLVTMPQCIGPVADSVADAQAPVKVGGKAFAGVSSATMATAANVVDFAAGIDRVQYIRPHAGLEDLVKGRATDTAGSSTSCIAAAGAGIKVYLTSVAFSNSSATNITVNIIDNATTVWTLPVPANSGVIWNPPTPLFPAAANTAWSFQGSAAATTLTACMLGFKSKV